MKGAHSIVKPRRTGRIVVVLCVVFVLALAGVATFAVATGKIDLPFELPQMANSSNAASQEGADQSRVEDSIESATAGAKDPDDASPAQTYTNPRFGYQVDIPVGFVLDSEADEGAGAVLANDALRMRVNVTGYNNVDNLDADALLASLWNGSADSIARAEGNRVIIYQYDDANEYFYWANIGPGSINQMQIAYPLQSDNRDELDAAQSLMQGFVPGDLNSAH